MTDLLKTDKKKEETSVSDNGAPKVVDQPYTQEQLTAAWNEFAEQRKKFQAEYQLLTQPYKVNDKQIIVTLLSPVHETMLNNIKVELSSFIREKLKNNSIQIVGELIPEDEKKIIYTNREKFDYLVEKNPILKELKDRLNLDTDF